MMIFRQALRVKIRDKEESMIYGVGTDVVSLSRIARLYKKYGHAFAQRLLSQIELLEFAQAGKPAHFLAKRFAAKEAFAKAVGTGIRGAVSFHRISVGHTELGKPEFIYEPLLQTWLDKHGIRQVHLSMSDEEDIVQAFAVAEGDTFDSRGK